MRKIGATLTLLLMLAIPSAIANIQTLYSWFPALRPALARAIDVVTGYVPTAGRGPTFKVSHGVRDVESGCRYNPSGTQCLQYDHRSVASLSIQSVNDYPIILKEIVINEKPQCSAVAVEPVIALAPPGEPAAAFPAPDRPVASIISPIWASEDERRSADETGQVFGLLGIKPGMHVADVGAGSGYYTMLLARAVGPQGEVIAEDITPDYLAALQKRVLKARLANVKVGLGEEHDPRLPARALDAAVLIHMYHEISQPYALLFNLAAAMKPESLVGIVDLDRPTDEHGTPPVLLRCELAAIGYREVSFHMLKGGVGYLAIFKPPLQPPLPSTIVACKSPR